MKTSFLLKKNTNKFFSKRESNHPFSVSRIFLAIGLVLLISSIGFYIFQVNVIIKESCLLKEYEKQISQYTQENKSLEINFSQINSLEKIEDLAQNLNYEKQGDIHYIQVSSGIVVAK